MRRRSDEGGAVAILVALLAIVLFASAALAVDLSNAFVRKRDVQRQADFGALAGGAELGAENTGPVPTDVVDAVRDQLNGPSDLNLVRDDANGFTAVTSAQLTDADLTNGEVRFVVGGLQVVAPQVQVDYSFARVMGYNATDVQADATVGLFTPGMVMPLYAVQGCDWGSQPITDPAAGDTPVIPPLAYDDHENATTLTSVTLTSGGVPITEIPLNTAGVVADLQAMNYTDITKVGFFRSDDLDTAAIVEEATFTPAHDATGYDKSGNGTIRFTIPTAVTSVEKAWYIRVYSAGTVNEWSKRQDAIPIRVGQAILECNSASSDGNFGSLKLPRINPTSDSSWLPVNIADGLEAPLTLAPHATPDPSGTCVDGLSGAVVSIKPNLREGTNCVETDTGLPANVATDGLINGSNGYPGALRATSSSSSDGGGCAPDGSTSAYNVLPGKSISNDVLTCFLTDGSTSLATIVDKNYAGSPVLSADIYESPRFFWQPILAVEPTSGGSTRYSIVDFRPAFLTDEIVAPTTIRNSHTATTANGITLQGGQIKQLRVVFFNAKALPASDTAKKVSPYLGSGPKILRLID